MRFALLTSGLQFSATLLVAQTRNLSVAVNLTDSAAGSVFQSGFAAGFRSLGDVDVVSLTDNPDYVLAGVAICQPADCRDPLSYSLALRLYEPISITHAQTIAMRVVPREYLARNSDSVISKLYRAVRYYENSHMLWVVTWGRTRYEQSMRELVREIDAGCFDRIRALNRAVGNKAKDSWEKYEAYEDSREWLC